MAKTSDMRKTKAELVKELQKLRRQVTRLQKQVEECKALRQQLAELQGRAEKEREQAEESPLRERDMLHVLMENVPDWIFFKDAESRIVKTNRAHALLLGFDDPQEIVGKTDFDLFPGEDAQRFYDEEQAMLQSGQPVVARLGQTPSKDGEALWVSETKIPLKDETGRVIGLVGISRDVTELRRAEETLKEAHAEIEKQVEERTAELKREIAEHKRTEAALVREGDLLQAFLDSTPDHIYFKDTESRFIRVSRSQSERFGLDDPADVVGKTDFDFFTEEHARPAYEDEQRIIRTGEPVLGLDEKETWPDRPDTWVLTSKMPLRDVTGNIVGTFGISSDVTGRKLAELALERRAMQLQVVAEVAREAASILDLSELLQRTVGLVSEGFGFYHTGIFMLDELRQYAVLRAASSAGGQRMLERSHQLPVGRMGVVGYVAEANEPRIALDVGDDAVFFDNPDLPETRSEMALPLTVRGEVIGVLDVQSTEPAAFMEEDVVVLRVLADQLAIAIENARLVQRTEEQVRELNLLYGQFTAETWGRLAAAGQALGYVYDRVDVSPADDSPSPAHSMALERDAVIELVDSETAGATLAVPLRVRDQVIGSLGVEAGDGREWSPEELALVEAVSEQVAQAIEGARLFAEAQKTALSMEALYQTSRAISSSLEEEALVRAVLEAVQRTLNCDYVLLSTVDEGGRIIGLRHGIWQGEFDIYPEWREMSQHPLDGHDIVPDVYRTGRTETILGWDERFNRELWDRFDLDRYLHVFMPIRLREKVIGVVEVAYDRRRKDSVASDEVQILAAFMDQAAVALENVRLFDQVQRRAQREHQIYEIANRLRRSPDISSILQTAVDELGQALRVDRALVRLRVRSSEERLGEQGAAGREEPPEG